MTAKNRNAVADSPLPAFAFIAAGCRWIIGAVVDEYHARPI